MLLWISGQLWNVECFSLLYRPNVYLNNKTWIFFEALHGPLYAQQKHGVKIIIKINTDPLIKTITRAILKKCDMNHFKTDFGDIFPKYTSSFVLCVCVCWLVLFVDVNRVNRLWFNPYTRFVHWKLSLRKILLLFALIFFWSSSLAKHAMPFCYFI